MVLEQWNDGIVDNWVYFNLNISQFLLKDKFFPN